MGRVTVTEIENGYNYKSNSSSGTNWITAIKDSQNLFIPTNTDFAIEFDITTTNLVGIYITKQNSNSFYHLSYNSSNLNHIKLEYTNNSIKYYLNNNLQRTTELDFDNSLAGFNITDWQGDMDINFTNFRIDKIP